jgi:hypothetical protein
LQVLNWNVSLCYKTLFKRRASNSSFHTKKKAVEGGSNSKGLAAFYFRSQIKINCMKKILFLAFLLAGVVAVNAQTKKDVQFGGGLRFGLPVGNFHYSHSIGIGVELQAEYKLHPQASLTGTTGFTNFIGKSTTYWGYKYKNDAAGYIPILVGGRYYASPNLFLSGKLGYGILTGGGSGGAFNIEPSVGYNTPKYQITFGYNALVDDGTLGHLGVTAIYKFN